MNGAWTRKARTLLSIVLALVGALTIILAAWVGLRLNDTGPHRVRMEFGRGLKRATLSGSIEKIQGGITARVGVSRLQFTDASAAFEWSSSQRSRMNSFGLSRPLLLGDAHPVFKWSAVGIRFELTRWKPLPAYANLAGGTSFLFSERSVGAAVDLPQWLLLLVGCAALIDPVRRGAAWWHLRRRVNRPAFPIDSKRP